MINIGTTVIDFLAASRAINPYPTVEEGNAMLDASRPLREILWKLSDSQLGKVLDLEQLRRNHDEVPELPFPDFSACPRDSSDQPWNEYAL